MWELKDGKLSGNLKIKSHYFEMGNMQFNLDKKYENLPVKDATKASEIVKAIQKVEDKVSLFLFFIFGLLEFNIQYQGDLEDMYDNI